MYYNEAAGPVQIGPYWSTRWEEAIPLIRLMMTCAAVQLSYSIQSRLEFISNGVGGHIRLKGHSGREGDHRLSATSYAAGKGAAINLF